MRITQRQLRQIIREELLREGMGDVRVAERELNQTIIQGAKAAFLEAFEDAIRNGGDGLRLILNDVVSVPHPGLRNLGEVLKQAQENLRFETAGGNAARAIEPFKRKLFALKTAIINKFDVIFANEITRLPPDDVKVLRTEFVDYVNQRIYATYVLLYWPDSMGADVANQIIEEVFGSSGGMSLDDIAAMDDDQRIEFDRVVRDNNLASTIDDRMFGAVRRELMGLVRELIDYA